MNIFLTGIRGFSGSRVAACLLDKGHTVYGLSRTNVPLPRVLSGNPRMHAVCGDLAGLGELPSGIDAVVHAAATSPVQATRVGELIRDNVVATENLVRLSLAAGIPKFFYFSSLSVFGRISGTWVDEKSPIVDPDPYGASKLFGEFSLRQNAERISSLAVRLPAVVGRGAQRHWLAGVLGRARRGEDIRIFNPGMPFNNAVHVGNLADFVNRWLELSADGFDVVTVASIGTLSIEDVVKRVVQATRSTSKIVVDPPAAQSFQVSSERAVREYGFSPLGIESTVDLYLQEELSRD